MEFSFWGMISHASLVAQIVLGLLVFMSIGSWAPDDSKNFSRFHRQIAGLARHRPVRQGAKPARCRPVPGADPSSPLYYIAHQGVMEF